MRIRQELGVTGSELSEWNLFLNVTTVVLFVQLLYDINIANTNLIIDNYSSSIKNLAEYYFPAKY